MTRYSKPALTFEQQADQLLARGMVGDRAIMIARLSSVNYYRLSAYWYTFREPNSDRVKPGTSFDHVWDRYVFDQGLRILVLEAIERIEVAVRTQLAYHHAHAFGPFGYAYNAASLPGLSAGSRRGTHAEFIDKVREEVDRNGREPFVAHFRNKYTFETALPIWMATEIMTLGSVVRFYQGCGPTQRQPVAAFFGAQINELESWLLTLNLLRNVCAHHARLWNRQIAKMPRIPPAWNNPVQLVPSTVFAALTVCAHCLTRVSPDTTWPKRLRELVDRFPSIPKDRRHNGWTMGLPPNWLECPIWARAR